MQAFVKEAKLCSGTRVGKKKVVNRAATIIKKTRILPVNVRSECLSWQENPRPLDSRNPPKIVPALMLVESDNEKMLQE